MIILGIDPGYAIVGFGAVRYEKNRFYHHWIRRNNHPCSHEFTSRLEEIYDGMGGAYRKYRPDCISVEKLYFNLNTTTAIAVAEAKRLHTSFGKKESRTDLRIHPLQVKSSVTGYGMAEKKQIMEMTRILLGLEKIPPPDDAADALALAICHGHSSGSLLSNKPTLANLNPYIKEGARKNTGIRTEDPKNEQNTQNTEKHT